MTQKRTSENDRVVSTGGAAPLRRKSTMRERVKRPAVSSEASSVSAPQPEVAAPKAVPTAWTEAEREEIARLAYSYWEARGCQGGDPEQDWLRAEQELRAAATTA